LSTRSDTAPPTCGRAVLLRHGSVAVGEEGAERLEEVATGLLREHVHIANPEAKAPFKYVGDLSDPQLFVDAFGHRAAYLLRSARRVRNVLKR
jgi:hypothetical protein